MWTKLLSVYKHLICWNFCITPSNLVTRMINLQHKFTFVTGAFYRKCYSSVTDFSKSLQLAKWRNQLPAWHNSCVFVLVHIFTFSHSLPVLLHVNILNWFIICGHTGLWVMLSEYNTCSKIYVSLKLYIATVYLALCCLLFIEQVKLDQIG